MIETAGDRLYLVLKCFFTMSKGFTCHTQNRFFKNQNTFTFIKLFDFTLTSKHIDNLITLSKEEKKTPC